MNYYTKEWYLKEKSVEELDLKHQKYSQYLNSIKELVPAYILDFKLFYDPKLVKKYFKENNYILILRISRQRDLVAKITFINAKIESEQIYIGMYWVYNEVSTLNKKFQMNILFDGYRNNEQTLSELVVVFDNLKVEYGYTSGNFYRE